MWPDDAHASAFALLRGQIIVKVPVEGAVTQDEIVYTLTPDAMTLGVKVAGAYAHATPPTYTHPHMHISIDLNASCRRHAAQSCRLIVHLVSLQRPLVP